MNPEKQRRRPRRESEDQLLENVFRSSSSTDCTGLIPTGIHSRAEQENYNEMYAYLPKAAPNRDPDGEEELPCANGGEVKKPE